MKLPEEIF